MRKHYLVANDNNLTGNTATVYEYVPPATLVQRRILSTGGLGSNVGIAAHEVAVDPSERCLFVADANSNDIAAFEAQTFVKVGNFSNQNLLTYQNQMDLVVSPNGQFLFGGYATTNNVGVWQINPDCSLTLVFNNPYGGAPSYGILLAVNSAGTELAESLDENGYVTSWGIASDGTLTSQPSIYVCGHIVCASGGVAITADGKVAIFGSDSQRTLYTAALSESGLSNLASWSLQTRTSLPDVIVFSPQAASGDGILYVGGNGFLNKSPRGFLTMRFTEDPLSITVLDELDNPTGDRDGMIQTMRTVGLGNPIAEAQNGNTILLYAIDPSTGRIAELSSTTDLQAEGMDSIVAYQSR